MSAIGPVDPLSSIVTLQQDALQQRVGVAVMKQQIDAERMLVSMLDSASRTVEAAPAPGTGTRVDLRA
ncbi:putative motility protein [Alsobacter sp. KACC 23698]|uniref:Motility protein n=1 Tax=Alsobacter sp. KACC 23698 TaxID=3149229 RepID=A0AAU7JDH6_9HYPH